MTATELTQERVLISTSDGTLCGELAYGNAEPTFAALVLNPHPYMGGSANNPLVRALHQHAAESGAAALRFDYRGVGASSGAGVDVAAAMAEFWKTGTAPHDPAMHADGAAALAWLQRTVSVPVALIGYSFGAHVAASIAPVGAPLVLISPTLTKHDYVSLGRQNPLLVVHSENDFATPAAALTAWADALPSRPRMHCIIGGEHFFKSREVEVAAVAIQFIRECLCI
jgi:alpha/beta superfamily hydrolase